MNDVPGVADDRAAYAGFWRRFAAYAIDYVARAARAAPCSASCSHARGLGRRRRAAAVADRTGRLFPLLHVARELAVAGDRREARLGLKVMNRRGERIGFARAAVRFVAKLLSVLTLCFGYLLIVVTRRRQALHDLIAGTLVAHDAHAAAARLARGNPVRRGLRAVVSACWLPSRCPPTRTTRSARRSARDWTLASGYRAAIETAWRNSPRDFADVTSDSIGAGLPQRGRYVESIEVVSGMIVITYGGEANGAVTGSVLTIVPALDSQPRARLGLWLRSSARRFRGRLRRPCRLHRHRRSATSLPSCRSTAP